MFAIPTHVQCCRVQGRKHLQCLGKGTTPHTCKHCCLESQHMQNIAGCKEGSRSIVPCIAWESLSTGASTVAYNLNTSQMVQGARREQLQHMLNVAGCEGGSSSAVWAWRPLVTGAGTISEGPMRPAHARLLPGHSLLALPAAGASPAAAGFPVRPQCACTGASCWPWCCAREPWDL